MSPIGDTNVPSILESDLYKYLTLVALLVAILLPRLPRKVELSYRGALDQSVVR